MKEQFDSMKINEENFPDEVFSALKKLYCGNIVIDERNVSKNPALEVLNCADTNITKLDVSKNPILKKLIFGWGR